jgi:ERCC4-type nuclease
VIVVDDRECASGICAELDALRVPYRVARVAVGDYLVNNTVIVERKTVADFLESLKDMRLFDQVARMRARNARALLIIEGPRLPAYPRIRAVLLSLAVQWQLPVVRSVGLANTAWSLAHIHGFHSVCAAAGHAYDFRAKHGRASLQVRLLQLVPGVGPAIATALLQKLGAFAKILAATPAKLMAVPGVGEHIAGQFDLLRREDAVRAPRSTCSPNSFLE